MAEHPNPDRAGPSPEDQPLLTVLAGLESSGYEGQMRAVDGGQVECLTCRTTFGADHIRAEQAVRLEGASDPADMLIVLPIICPHCATAGTLVANYGPEAQIEEAEVLRRIERSGPAGGDGSRQ